MSELHTVTIGSGQSLSDAAKLVGEYVVEIVMPSAWDAAALTFQVGEEPGALQDVYAEFAGGEYVVDAAIVDVDRRIKLDPADLLGDGYLKVRSGTAGTPVAQTAAREITLKTRRLV